MRYAQNIRTTKFRSKNSVIVCEIVLNWVDPILLMDVCISKIWRTMIATSSDLEYIIFVILFETLWNILWRPNKVCILYMIWVKFYADSDLKIELFGH